MAAPPVSGRRSSCVLAAADRVTGYALHVRMQDDLAQV
jgi:hypothetical protein